MISHLSRKGKSECPSKLSPELQKCRSYLIDIITGDEIDEWTDRKNNRIYLSRQVTYSSVYQHLTGIPSGQNGWNWCQELIHKYLIPISNYEISNGRPPVNTVVVNKKKELGKGWFEWWDKHLSDKGKLVYPKEPRIIGYELILKWS